MKLSNLFTQQERKLLTEYTVNSFSMKNIAMSYSPISATDLHRMLPKTAKTSKDAIQRLKAVEGQELSAHSQVTYVQTKGTNGENIQKLQFKEIQYFSKSMPQTVSIIYVTDITGTRSSSDGSEYSDSNAERIGYAIVYSDVLSHELRSQFNVLRRQS